jgi:diguanylate cyclase (GGDEF)-like protein
MSSIAYQYVLNLIAPALIAVFGLAFLFAWFLERSRGYLLRLTCACLIFCAAVTVHIFAFQDDDALNAVAGNTLYVAAVITLASGLLQRSGKSFGYVQGLAVVAVSSALIFYFAYIDPNLSARVYVQNFGFGAILLITALQLRRLARSKLADRVLFWTLLLFAVQFFPRTLITMQIGPSLESRAFGMTIFWQMFQLSIAILGIALVFAMLMAVMSDIIEGMKDERDTDTLTGLANRRRFDQHMEDIWAKSSSLQPSLILCDLDHFKRINDDHGHSMGDAVLRRFAEVLSSNMRDTDKVFRIGGEEFAIIVYAPAEAAQILIDRLREVIENASFPSPEPIKVTASFGLAMHERGETAQDWFDRTDSALYAAKRQGRNRAVIAASRGVPQSVRRTYEAPTPPPERQPSDRRRPIY